LAFHWENAPFHTATTLLDCLVAMNIKSMLHTPNMRDLVPGDCVLFPKVTIEHAGISMTQEAFQKNWEGVKRTIAKEIFIDPTTLLLHSNPIHNV
jgi:hypothetical protein